MDISAVNWLAVAVATVASFILGGVWYGPLFSVQWQALVGLSTEELEGANPAMIFGPAFILTLVQALLLALLLPAGSGLAGGAGFGALLGAGFIATGLGVNYLFARNPRGLWAIDAGFNVVQLALMGAIIGAWP